MLMNIETLKWDPQLCKVFGIPMSVLPEIRSSSEIYGCLTDSVLKGVPISGVSRADLQRHCRVIMRVVLSVFRRPTGGLGGSDVFPARTGEMYVRHGLLSALQYGHFNCSVQPWAAHDRGL